MSDATELKPYAMWTDDCQGKKDFDGPLISISTRYYPGPDGGGFMVVKNYPGKPLGISEAPYGPKPTARSAVILNLGPCSANDGGGDALTWREMKFAGDTEADVKAQVEAWTVQQMRDIVNLFGGIKAFTS